MSIPSQSRLPAALPRPRRAWRTGRVIAAAATVVATLAGCSTAPLSFLNDRQVYHRTVLNRYPVRVVAIDGTYTAFRPVPIAPGTHVLTIDAFPVAGFSQPVQKRYPMTIEPCTRYYIAAQRQTALSQDWELVVEQTWPVAGCDPQREREKASAALSGVPNAASSTLLTVAPPRGVAAAAAPSDVATALR